MQIMGPLRVWRGEAELDTGPRQQRCLLALLMARVGQPVSMTDLIALLWGQDSPASAANVIQKYIGALRRVLEPGLPVRTSGSYLLLDGSGYRFTAGLNTLDLIAFRHHVTAATASADREELRQALNHYIDALRLCRGTAGDTLADSPAAIAVFAAIDEEFLEAAVNATEIAIRLREPTSVLSPLRLAAEMNPFHERVHASLVAALAASGQQAEALTAYRRIRERLVDELGIDPGHALQRAFRQVLAQHDIESPSAVAATVDESEVPGVRPAQLPPDLSLFVGRSAELAALSDLVAGMRDGERGGPLVVAIDGMGGVGKSTLAVHFARLAGDEFTDGQLYLDLHSDHGDSESGRVGEALRSLLLALGVPSSTLPDTFDARMGKYRSLTAGRRILVLLDNVRNSAQVRPLLPNSAQSLVLVTSRRPLLGLAAFDGAHLLRVQVPDLPSARQLLERRLAGAVHRTIITPDSAALVDEIVELCGRLPLALAVLAAQLAVRPTLTLASVAADLRDGARRLQAFPGGTDTPDPRTAFSWSYQQLTTSAARLFRLLSVSLGPGITVAACASLSGSDAAATRAELDELIEAALVTEHEHGRITSHMLVKAYAHELFIDTEPLHEQRDAVSRLLQYYLHGSFHAQAVLAPHQLPFKPAPPLPGVVPDQPATFEQAVCWFSGQREALIDAVRVAAELGFGIVPWQLAVTMQQYLQWSGYFEDWEDAMRHALRSARDSDDEIGQAHVLHSLGGARRSLGADDEALDLLTAALHIFDSHTMRLEQALVHSDLHAVHEALGDDHQALAHSQEALTLYRALDYRQGVPLGLMSSGRSLARLGRLEESAELLNLALELHAQTSGSDATSIAAEAEIRIAVAADLARLGRIRESAEQLELSAQLAGQTGHRPHRFEALRQLTELLLAAGDLAGASEALSRTRVALAAFPDGGAAHLRAELADLTAKVSPRRR
ncbi:DNA-binding SARP family transcriptional activator [Catellatospora citrea]|nr:DNA-binding SARP family transcriptional activator [Catellatospora citrea]